MAVAYLRVSTDKQCVDNQKNEIIKFARKKGVKIDKWYQEIVSGKENKNKRKLNAIINKMKSGDTLIVSEMSRISRISFDVMSVMGTCIMKNINLYSVKEDYKCDDTLMNKMLGMMFSLFAELERVLISQRTKEALAKKKSEGVILGRPKGASKIWDNLVKNTNYIIKLLKQKIPKSQIAKKLNISRVTLYKFIKSLD